MDTGKPMYGLMTHFLSIADHSSTSVLYVIPTHPPQNSKKWLWTNSKESSLVGASLPLTGSARWAHQGITCCTYRMPNTAYIS